MTLLIAGIRALYERDIKKMVALSTLSQLGLIFCTLGKGLIIAAFLHLVTHAYFKAILFISVGNIIHLSDDYQDLRKVNLNFSKRRFTLTFRIVANFSLIGIPFLAGFFSKDLILELLLINNRFSYIRMILFYLGCILTSVYSFRFMYLVS